MFQKDMKECCQAYRSSFGVHALTKRSLRKSDPGIVFSKVIHWKVERKVVALKKIAKNKVSRLFSLSLYTHSNNLVSIPFRVLGFEGKNTFLESLKWSPDLKINSQKL